MRLLAIASLQMKQYKTVHKKIFFVVFFVLFAKYIYLCGALKLNRLYSESIMG